MLSQKVNPEELQNLRLRKHRRRKHPIRLLIEDLEVGEVVKIYPQEYNPRSRNLRDLCTRISHDNGHLYEVSEDLDKGLWFVVRER
ncbi:MAG: hypothetical protein ACKVOR_10565 [Flavobacteriales bacterium]